MNKTEGRSLRSGFLNSATRTPDAPALRVAGHDHAYAAVAHQARVWAQAVTSHLGRPARRVGVFAWRSLTAYTGILAAMCCGGAFVPLNKKLPPARTREMLLAADLDALIVDTQSAPQLAEVLAGVSPAPLIIAPDKETRVDLPKDAEATVLDHADLAAMQPLGQLPPVTPYEMAYLLFTSGSTGKPKGVPVLHSNALHFVDCMVRRFAPAPQDRFSQTFDLTFDPSIFDIFVAWEAGASFCAMTAMDILAPTRFVNNNAVTIWYSVPSIPALMRKKGTLKPKTMPSLRWSLFAGEALPEATALAWQEAAPDSIVENLYGPTELTVTCFAQRFDPASAGNPATHGYVPMGRPNAGLGALIVDENLQPVRPGEQGELCVCGPQTVPGYWRNPEQTAARFVHLPVPDAPPVRFYRTGDRVLQLEDGAVHYLGRMDHMVKVLGNRVELAEVEFHLLQCQGVVEAIVMGHPFEATRCEALVAFLGGQDIEPEAVQEQLRARLPDYMVPRHVHLVHAMPLNASGKVDRKTLCAMFEAERVA